MVEKRKVPRQPAKNEQVVITDDLIRMMLHDTRFLSQFACMKQAKLQATKKKCNCGGSRMKLNKVNLGKLRRHIANMPAGKKLKLKQLLNAKTVQVKFTKVAGGVAVKRF